jgi:hypothetical protein
MRKSRHVDIRAALLKAEDGLTRKELSELIGVEIDSIRRAVKSMPDVYIDRWLTKGSGAPRPVYMAVEVPEDCPNPRTKRVRQFGDFANP